jgi:MFS transporter, DHA2 family, methylenomycin A resistance protein
MLPGTLAVITSSYPEGAAQARAIGIWAGIGSVALPAGPLLGGMLTQAVSWRAVFFLGVPIVAVALVLAARTVPESRGRRRQPLDIPGVVLGAVLLALVTSAFIGAGRSGLDTPVVTAIVAAVALALAFVVVERSRTAPMLPLALFRRPSFSAANALAGTMNLATLGLLFVLTLYLQDVRRLSALGAGIQLLPLFLPLSVIAPLGGRIVGRFGARWPMSAGLLLAAAGVGLLAPLGARSGYGALVPALLLWGVGLAVLTPAVVAAAVAAVPAERAGLASAINNTARQAAGAIGIAAFGALAGAPARHEFLGGLHAAAVIAAGLFATGALLAAYAIRAR